MRKSKSSKVLSANLNHKHILKLHKITENLRSRISPKSASKLPTLGKNLYKEYTHFEHRISKMNLRSRYKSLSQ